MRRTLGLATVAVLAAGTIGVQAGTANGQVARTPGIAAAAVAALQQHPVAARDTAGHRAVVAAFGPEAVDKSGELDRAWLRRRVR